MATFYNTPRGSTYEPVQVYVWHWEAASPTASIDHYERVNATWSIDGAGTIIVETEYNVNTQDLLDTDGRYLLVLECNGLRLAGIPAKAEIHGSADAPDKILIRITTGTPWSMLDGVLIPPNPDREISQQSESEYFHLNAPVETVVKRLLEIAVKRSDLPIVIMPDLGRGDSVKLAARLESAGELISEALLGTGYYLDLDIWVPGDSPISGQNLNKPTVIAEVKQAAPKLGLIWDYGAGDFGSWKYTTKRQSATRCITLDDGEGVEQKMGQSLWEDQNISPWMRREVSVEQKDTETPVDAANRCRMETARSTEVDLVLLPTTWEFGKDEVYPLQYQIGDIPTIHTPVATHEDLVITEVEVEITPMSMTVTPKIGSL